MALPMLIYFPSFKSKYMVIYTETNLYCILTYLLNLNSPLWNFTWKCHIFRSDLSKLFSGDSSFVENGFPIQSACFKTATSQVLIHLYWREARKEQIQCEMCQIYLEVGRPVHQQKIILVNYLQSEHQHILNHEFRRERK